MVIKCPKCQKYISSNISVCPNCGEALEISKNMETSDSSVIEELRNKIDSELRMSKKNLDLDTSEPSLTFQIEKMNFPGGRINITLMYDLDWTKDVSALSRAKDLLDRFKQSPYFAELEDWDEEIEQERFQCSGSVLKADIPTYLAELFHYLGLTQSDVSKSKGCFGIILLLVIFSLTTVLSL